MRASGPVLVGAILAVAASVAAPFQAGEKKGVDDAVCVCALVDVGQTPTDRARKLDGKAVALEGQAVGWGHDGKSIAILCPGASQRQIDVIADKAEFLPQPDWVAAGDPIPARVKGTVRVVKGGARDRVEVAFVSFERIAFDAKDTCDCGCSRMRKTGPGQYDVTKKGSPKKAPGK